MASDTASDDVRYTREHEWVRVVDAPAGTVRVGVTDFAQSSLGDVVFVSLPQPGLTVEAGAPLGEIESTKSVSELYAPFAGEVVARNDELDRRPELVNAEPYGDGWMVDLRVDPAALTEAMQTLLDATTYETVTRGDG